MAASFLPAGKLSPEMLSRLLRHTSRAPELVVGAGVGEDAAVINTGSQYLVVSTDPITFTTEHCGWYSVCVNANDIAACGGTPRYYSASIVLPAGQTTPEEVEELFAEIGEACRQTGVLWVGGHTEVSPAVNEIVVVGQMLGEVAPDDLCRSSDARVGDVLVLVKAAAIEATAIIARERPAAVEEVQGAETLNRTQNFLYDPGISVVREAQLARGLPVHAMHDPTEGGVVTGIREICLASNCGVLVRAGAITVLPETAGLCRQFGLDPLGAISSGALLLTLPAAAAGKLLRRYRQTEIPAAVIGEILPPAAGLQLQQADGTLAALPDFPADEITKLFQ